MKIFISKSGRKLTLFQGGAAVFSCPAALGRDPIGPKAREGDGKTPEGRYFVCTRNPNSKYHLSLGISYPSPADGEAALREGRIDPEAFEAICRAAREGRRPPWDTPLGGFIMIHGGGAVDDWTAGCVALSDGDMDALWPLCPLGTEVEIVP